MSQRTNQRHAVHNRQTARYETIRQALLGQLALGQARAVGATPSGEPRPRPRTAQQLVERHRIRLSPAARERLAPHWKPAELFEELLAADLDPDARRVLACALPRRRALWWGCLYAWDALGKLAAGTGAEALRAVAAYVAQPCDEHWRDVARIGRNVKRASLLGCLIYGTFVAHGTVCPPDKPRVPAPPHVFGRLIESAVYLAAVSKDVRQYRRHLRAYLLLGRQLAGGPPPWNHAVSPGEPSP